LVLGKLEINFLMANNFEFLNWDSDFFNLQIGKLVGDKELHDLELKDFFEKEIDLIYYYTQEPLSKDFSSEYYEPLLVDLKIPVKKLVGPKKVNPKISFFLEKTANQELIQLAQLAGIHTRFKVDPKISEAKFNELFKIWIEKSVDGQMASKVFVYVEAEKIVGFATALLDGETGYAPLLAVNRDYEGLGISFAIMNAVESYMYENGCKTLVSSTQGVNNKALRIYERWGCEFDRQIYVYHLWSKKLNFL